MLDLRMIENGRKMLIKETGLKPWLVAALLREFPDQGKYGKGARKLYTQDEVRIVQIMSRLYKVGFKTNRYEVAKKLVEKGVFNFGNGLELRCLIYPN